MLVNTRIDYEILLIPGVTIEEAGMDDRWMTVKEVAEYLQLSSDQIYHLAQQGRIPVSKVGARWRFKKDKIDRWMEANSSTTPNINRIVT